MEEATVIQGGPEWQALRASCDLTCSEFGAALGMGRFETRGHLWRKKVGRPTEAEVRAEAQMRFNPHPAIEHGKKTEEEARQMLEQIIGPIRKIGFQRFDPWPPYDDVKMGASPDGICEADGCPVEIKCPYDRPADPWPFAEYYLQAQGHIHSMPSFCGGCHFWSYGSDTGDYADYDGKSYYCFIPRCSSFQWAFIMDHLCLFVTQHIRPKIAPPVHTNRGPIQTHVLDEHIQLCHDLFKKHNHGQGDMREWHDMVQCYCVQSPQMSLRNVNEKRKQRLNEPRLS